MSADGQMDPQNVAHPCNGMVFSHEKEQNTQRLRVADEVYEKCPEEANPETEGRLVVVRAGLRMESEC